MAVVISLPKEVEARVNRLLIRRKMDVVLFQLTPEEQKEATRLSKHKGIKEAQEYVLNLRLERTPERPTKTRLIEELVDLGLKALGE